MFVTDVLEVLYAPHKVFKKIIQNPKYWGPLLILVIFVAAQTSLFFAQYSKTYYEGTAPPIGQLTTWTDSSLLWTAPGVTVSSNLKDIFNTTFYGNSSLQFAIDNSSSIAMTINDLNGSVNCGPDGFPDLYLQIKFVEPAVAPSSATIQLFSLDSSSYFQTDLTSTFANASTSEWNNYTIPVGSGNWQSSGNPLWTNITGIKMDMTFPDASNVTLRIGGLFFRGMYQNPIEIFGVSGFAASASFSAIFSFIIQWLGLAIVFFLIIKLFKGTITWRPLFVAVAFSLITMAVETLVILAATATLPAQIYYPFEFAFGYQLSYPAQYVTMFSVASQAIYNSVIATQIATYSSIATFIAIAVYAWIAAIGAAIIRAMTEFNWMKSIFASATSVVVTYVLLSLLTAIGII
ncbi:MAG: hypothetical protein NWF05_10600 [Candidatus Bathyarchaeota archaeon]|nr:hypothetical protein [Candidatus Bathyarchaeota archaeon]